MAVISIAREQVIIGKHHYRPEDNVEPGLLAQMRPELAGFLQPGESRARKVAVAIRRLHIKAIRDCLAE